MKKYDFKVEAIDVFGFTGSLNKDLESIIGEYGSEGYQLVSSMQCGNLKKYALVFQKEV